MTVFLFICPYYLIHEPTRSGIWNREWTCNVLFYMYKIFLDIFLSPVFLTVVVLFELVWIKIIIKKKIIIIIIIIIILIINFYSANTIKHLKALYINSVDSLKKIPPSNLRMYKLQLQNWLDRPIRYLTAGTRCFVVCSVPHSPRFNNRMLNCWVNEQQLYHIWKARRSMVQVGYFSILIFA